MPCDERDPNRSSRDPARSKKASLVARSTPRTFFVLNQRRLPAPQQRRAPQLRDQHSATPSRHAPTNSAAPKQCRVLGYLGNAIFRHRIQELSHFTGPVLLLRIGAPSPMPPARNKRSVIMSIFMALDVFNIINNHSAKVHELRFHKNLRWALRQSYPRQVFAVVACFRGVCAGWQRSIWKGVA